MNAAGAPKYIVRDGDAVADRDAVLGVWAGNLGHEARMSAKYDWFYNECPHGAPLMQLLFHDTQAVGTSAAGLRAFVGGDSGIIQAGVLVDLAVLPEHRSLGPAMMLQQALVATADQKLDMLYGFPNQKAVPVFKRMGYVHAADMVRYVRVLRHGTYLQRRLPRGLAWVAGAVLDAVFSLRQWIRRMGARSLQVELLDALDTRIAELHAKNPMPGIVTCQRTLAHLQWRFDAAPLERFRHVLIHDPDSGGVLAWACWRDDGHAATVLDFWSEAPEHGFPAACIEALCATLRRAGHASVQVELATSPERLANWRAAGFVARGSRPVYLRWRKPPAQAVDMHITSADEDE